jgi:hypothetical protein
VAFRRINVLIIAVVATAASLAGGQNLPAEMVGAATAASATTATASPTHMTAPKAPVDEQTDPRMRPVSGKRHTAFAVLFTLREAPGHQGVFAVDYRVRVSRPARSSPSCASLRPPNVDSGTAGAIARVRLTPPAHGWCLGRYRVTVFLQRGPYCPPPVQGQPPTPCPEFATQELDTGDTSFAVRPSASAPR